MNLSKELETLFYQALDLSEEQRQIFLEKACGTNVRLREDILSLLRTVDRGANFFEELPERLLSVETVHKQNQDNQPETRVGPWQLCELLGRGGMGTVYLAERADFQYSRQVAIKVLPLGADDPIARYRFKSEQQILAQLNHENIARFIDGGVTEEGLRYIVMDYIKGDPLNIYCKKHAPTVKSKLQLFLQICRAVQYAHQHKVIHRDLKPANILVTEEHEVKLLDFGIAKIPGEENAVTELTRAVARPLTMAYASPEMINGEVVDKRTDVYSLGVILYELLTGNKPFRMDSTLKQFYDDQQAGIIKRPSLTIHKKQLATLPSRDIDTVILKALNNDINQRYASAQSLQDDIECILAGHPIKARPYNPFYHFTRFIFRHKAVSVSALAIFLILGCASVFSFLQMREAQSQRDLATMQQRHVQASNDFLNLLLEEIGPDGEAMTLEQLLKRGQRMLEQQAATQKEPAYMGRVLFELAQGFGSIGNMQESHRLLQRSEKFAREHKDDDLLSIVLCTYIENNISLDFEFAQHKYLEAKEVQGRLATPSIDSEIICDKAHAMLLEKTGQAEKALKVLDSSILKLQEIHPGSSNLLFQLLSLRTHALYSLGRQSELLEANSRLLQLYRESGRSSTSSYMITLQNHAVLLDMMGEIAASTKLRKTLVEKFSEEDAGQQVPVDIEAHYADSLVRMGEYAQAIEIYKRGLAIAGVKGDVLRAANNQTRIGRALIELNAYAEAEHYLSLAKTQFAQSPETNKRRLDRIRLAQIRLLRKQGELTLAQQYIEELLTSADYPNVKQGFAMSQVLRESAQIALANKDADRAAQYINDLLLISRSLARNEQQSADVGYALILKGELYLLLQQPEQAKYYFHDASERLLAAAGESHPDTRNTRKKLMAVGGVEMVMYSQ